MLKQWWVLPVSKFRVMQLELHYNRADILFHGGQKQTQMCLLTLFNWRGFQGGSVVKNLPVSARDAGVTGSIPGSGRSPGGGNGNPLQYSCLNNPTAGQTWQPTVQRVTKSWTRLTDHTCTHSSTELSKYNILNNSSENINDLHVSLITDIFTKTMQAFQEGIFLIWDLLFF